MALLLLFSLSAQAATTYCDSTGSADLSSSSSPCVGRLSELGLTSSDSFLYECVKVYKGVPILKWKSSFNQQEYRYYITKNNALSAEQIPPSLCVTAGKTFSSDKWATSTSEAEACIEEIKTTIPTYDKACDAAVCGNGKLEAGEVCDDGNTLDTDTCSAKCQKTVCGDGLVNKPNSVGLQEECDSNAATCVKCKKGICGDGVLQLALKEECDDGNALGADGCSETCKIEKGNCGNEILEGTETCDDGNDVGGDGCDACKLETGFTCVKGKQKGHYTLATNMKLQEKSIHGASLAAQAFRNYKQDTTAGQFCVAISDTQKNLDTLITVVQLHEAKGLMNSDGKPTPLIEYYHLIATNIGGLFS